MNEEVQSGNSSGPSRRVGIKACAGMSEVPLRAVEFFEELG
jgi:hypothetical protein